MNQKNARKWVIQCVLSLFAMLFFMALLVAVVDPYFHYHKPFPFISYRLYEERYTNDGISRHFDFDAIITGTSMAQNFKPSEMDALFGTNSVKETFSGAGYQELADNLDRALSRNPDLKHVLWALDYNGLLRDYDWAQYGEYPTYLYDDNPLNDVSYLFNKSILYHGVLNNINMTLSGASSTTMDEYSAWQKETGLDQILASYQREDIKKASSTGYGDSEQNAVIKTITENVLRIVNKYPETIFYIFYSPYSICYWDSLHIEGTLTRQIRAEQTATELLLSCPNVKLYSFSDQYDVVCNTDNYSDGGHYSSEVNSWILKWIHDGTGLITRENYQDKLQKEQIFYSEYDYDSIYQ